MRIHQKAGNEVSDTQNLMREDPQTPHMMCVPWAWSSCPLFSTLKVATLKALITKYV